MSTSIVLCGVGGQGTVLASKLVASAAMKKGFEVKSAETIGMAQKGGSVMSHLRIGDDVSSPMIGSGEADLIIGFEPSETVRMLPFLKKGGSIITSDRPIMPVTAALKGSSYKGTEMTDYLKSLSDIEKLVIVDTEEAVRGIGVASRSGLLGDITHEDIIEAMKRKVKPQFVEMNIRALEFVRI